MTKISFTKLGLNKNTEIASFDWNGQTIEVKQYLPIQEKMEIISSVLNQCQDENNFINEAKLSLFMDLEMIYKYTNINITEKQKEDPAKLYDLFAGTGLFNEIFTVLPDSEYKCIAIWLNKTAEHIYEYRNSIYGILDAMNTDYSNLELDADSIREKIADPNSLSLLKDVLTKLG